MNLFPLAVRTLRGPISCISRTFNYSCWSSWIQCSSPEDTVWLRSSPTSGSYNLSDPFVRWPLSLGEVIQNNVPILNMNYIIPYSLPLIVSVLLHLLHSTTSLMRLRGALITIQVGPPSLLNLSKEISDTIYIFLIRCDHVVESSNVFTGKQKQVLK